MKRESGFTLVEVLVASVVLSVGLLGLASTGGLVTRMVARGQRSAVAATFAQKRLERLRLTACTAQSAGADTLNRGGTWAAINSWSFADAGNSTWRIVLTSTYKTYQNHTRAEQSEAEVSCA